MKLGRAIKLCRVQRGLSQSDLANATGLSVSYLSLLERNKRDPTITTILKLSNRLAVPFIILVFLASDDQEKSKLDPVLQEKLSHAALTILE